MKNEDGSPKVFYYGTDKDFLEFKDSAFCENDTGSADRGFYFSSNNDISNMYSERGAKSGGNVIP